MATELTIIGLNVALPALISAAVSWILVLCAPSERFRRAAGPIAFGVAFFGAYQLLPPWAFDVPKRHWQWMPYLALMTTALGPWLLAGTRMPATDKTTSQGANRIARLGKLAIIVGGAGVAAWLLVPHWKDLQPARVVWLPVLTGYLVALTFAIDSLSQRSSPRLLMAALAASALLVVIVIAGRVSLTYARPAGLAAAALGGCWVVSLKHRDLNLAQGLAQTYAIAIGGWTFVGAVDPKVPLLWMFLLPCLPLALWPLAKYRSG